MPPVAASPIPPHSLLAAYPARGAYADAYAVEAEGRLALAEYVEAFYTTWLFRLERWILVLASRPSTDDEAALLGRGKADRFAAWTVESRAVNEILLCDYTGRTRSWLMVEPLRGSTRLWFGSAIVPRNRPGDVKPELGFPFNALLGFHKLYSVALLRAALARLRRQRAAT